MPGIIPPPDLARREVRRALRIGMLYATLLNAVVMALVYWGIRA